MVLYTDGKGHFFQYKEGVDVPAWLTPVKPTTEGETKTAKPADTKQVRKVSKKNK